MPTTTPLTDAINALTTYANETTGASDTTLSDAVETLVEGYGQGGGGWTTEGITSGTEPNGDIDINANGDITTIATRAFSNKPITSVTIHGTPYFGNYAFSETQITRLSMPDMVALKSGYYNVANYVFSTNRSLTDISAPKLESGGSYFFQNCSALQTVVFPSLRETSSNMFVGCSALTTADFGNSDMTGDHWVRHQTFLKCTNLTTLILRSPQGARLENIGAFQDSPFASGKSGGALYVPQALISSYQSASNWSTILGYANNQILPIEGSIYETQYADGTPIE